jgi:hypothetical protein
VSLNRQLPETSEELVSDSTLDAAATPHPPDALHAQT